MRSSSPPRQSSQTSPSVLSQISLSAIVQYAFLAFLAYILAGAPLSSLLNSSSSSSPSSFLSILSDNDPAAAANARDEKVVDVGKLKSLVIPEKNLTCKEHRYKGVYVLSRDPLVVYIEGFLGEEEGKEVVELSEPHFTPSTIWSSGAESLQPSIRLSEKAPLPRSQTVKCIEDRARTFQGWRPNTFIEKLWAQRYGVGGHYTYHYDWSIAGGNNKKSGRVSSFMVYVDGECEGGGTHFPRLERPAGLGRRWCDFIECDVEGVYRGLRDFDTSAGAGQNSNTSSTAKMALKPLEDLTQGVIFKPIPGNAVYWENMHEDGSGYAESWHAGLPVTRGEKIGLNIWSWMVDGYVPPLDEVLQEEEG